MEKNTLSFKSKVRWLKTKTLILMLFGFILSFWGVSAQTYTYTGSVQTVTLSAGTYEIEMWGADGETAGGQPAGGIGGYSKGTYTVTSSTTIYIGVGGKGNLSPTSGAFAPGGWNGGGQGYASTIVGAGGGGASHVATVTGDLPSLSSNQSAVIIVAGGAGGSGWNGVGGHGGGLIGGNGNSGTGGSTGGTFGQGANGASGSTVGGGGGGWFGGNLGNPGNTGGSGGGSGYIGGVSNGVTIMFGDPGFVSNPDTAGNGTVIITNMAPCTGTPTAGTATVSLGTCYGDPFSLSVSGSTNAGNITYQWQSSPAGTGTWTNIGGATTSSHIVTNQTADTDYRFVVTCTNSSSSDTSNVVNVALAPTGNFSENFDTTPTGSSSNPSLPDCWSYVDEVTSTGYGYVNNANAFSGSNSFRLYKTNSSSNQGQNLILISPQTDNLGNGTKQLRFYARAAAASNLNHLEIVRANGNDATATFTVIQPLIIDHIGYQEYVVPLPVTTDDYFGFRLAHNGVTTLSTVHLDDVFYEDLDTCAPPTGITVTNIGQTSADISWTASTSSGATQYEYEVRTTGDPGSGTTRLGATGIVTGLTASVTGLSASLEYSVYVRSICGTTPGRWMHVPEIFNTLCGVVTEIGRASCR